MTSHQITNPQTHHTHPKNNLERARKGEEQSLAAAEGCPRMGVLQCQQPPGTAQELLTALGARTGPPHLSLSHTRALEQWRDGGISHSVISQGLLLQPATSQVLSCHIIIPVKPETVYFGLRFCSWAHTTASEKVYQQFHLHLFPALLTPVVMSIVLKSSFCFKRLSIIYS